MNGQAFHLGLRTQKRDLQTQSVRETWKRGWSWWSGEVGVCGGDGVEEGSEPTKGVC